MTAPRRGAAGEGDFPVIFRETALPGAYVLEPERREDERGFFARTWCRQEFEARGLDARLVQCSVSFNRRRGTLRGLHFQAPPREEPKVVRCTRGSLFDVVVDLRPDSPTRFHWAGVTLTAENRLALYVPPGLAHGFQTLEDETEVFYQIGELYYPELARGVRWDDPAFGVAWPLPDPILSERDRGYVDVSRA